MTIRRVIMSATSRIKGGRPSKPETKPEKNVATKAQIRAFQSKSSPIYKSQSESSLVSGLNNLTIADKRKQSSNKPPINRRGFCTTNSGRLNIRSLQDAAMLFKNEQVQNVVVVAGAGISTPSGIPDFRTPGTGLYDNLQQYKIPYPEAIFDIDYFYHNPKPFFTLAKELFPSLGNYRPNYIHYFVKLLHEKGLLLRMYTQNIDGLERLAGIPASKLVEAHGTFATATCTLCGDRCDGDDIKERISLEQIPKCKKKSCSGMVKPDIVFFGEDLPRKFYYHLKDMLQADVVLVMGTSLEVQPFAGIIDSVRWNVPRVLFNRDVVGPFKRQRRSKDFVAEGDILETLQKFSAMIGWQDEMREIITKSEGCYNVGKVTVPPSVPKPPSKQPGIKDPYVKAIWHQNARFDVFEYSSTSDSESSSEESSSTESDSSQDRKKPRPVSERLYNKSKHSAKNKSAFNSNTGSANRKYSTQSSTQSARTATTKPSAGSKRHVPVIKGSRRNSLTGCNVALLPASTTAGNASSSCSRKIGSAKNSVDINVQSTTTVGNSSSSSSRKIGSAKNSVKMNVQSTTADGTPSSSGNSVNINVQPTATESTLSSSSGKVGTSKNSVNTNVQPISSTSSGKFNAKNSVNGNVQPITSETSGTSSSGKVGTSKNSVNGNVQPNGTGSTFSTSTTATESTGATSSGKIGTSVNSVNVNVQPLIIPPVSLNSLSRSNSVRRHQEKFSPPSNHQPKSSNYPNSSNSQPNSSNSQSKYSNSQFSNSSNSQPNSSNSQPRSTNSQPNSYNSQPQSTTSQINSYNSPSSSSQPNSYNSQTKSTDSQPQSRHSLSKPTTSQTKDNSRKNNENTRNGLSAVKTLRAFRERTRSADLPKLRLREKLGVRKVVETSSSESVNGTSSSNS